MFQTYSCKKKTLKKSYTIVTAIILLLLVMSIGIFFFYGVRDSTKQVLSFFQKKKTKDTDISQYYTASKSNIFICYITDRNKTIPTKITIGKVEYPIVAIKVENVTQYAQKLNDLESKEYVKSPLPSCSYVVIDAVEGTDYYIEYLTNFLVAMGKVVITHVMPSKNENELKDYYCLLSDFVKYGKVYIIDGAFVDPNKEIVLDKLNGYIYQVKYFDGSDCVNETANPEGLCISANGIFENKITEGGDIYWTTYRYDSKFNSLYNGILYTVNRDYLSITGSISEETNFYTFSWDNSQLKCQNMKRYVILNYALADNLTNEPYAVSYPKGLGEKVVVMDDSDEKFNDVVSLLLRDYYLK